MPTWHWAWPLWALRGGPGHSSGAFVIQARLLPAGGIAGIGCASRGLWKLSAEETLRGSEQGEGKIRRQFYLEGLGKLGRAHTLPAVW